MATIEFEAANIPKFINKGNYGEKYLCSSGSCSPKFLPRYTPGTQLISVFLYKIKWLPTLNILHFS